jgi:putative MATE family efflux protein
MSEERATMKIFSFFDQKKACSTGDTQGVTILTGDPKKAIISLSGPMIIAMLLMSSYNIVNAVWVVGLGSDALAAIGFMTPVFFIVLGLGTGIGAGATSAIARRIGANDRNGANNCAVHALLIALILSVIVTPPLVIFAEPIALLFGAGETAGLAAAYGQVLFAGSFFILFVNIAYGILRAEGDARRTMHAMVAATLLNIVLDPILIYGLGLGIAGAAWGTIISLAAATIVLCYWFFIKKDTYVCFSRQVFIPSRSVVSDILYVGIPASVEYLLMSALNIILNLILVMVATTDAVAVFSVGFRVVSFGIVPIVAIGTSVVSVVGAAYGARHFEKIRVAHTFSIIFGLAIALAISILTGIFAYPIASVFSYSPESAHLYPAIAAFIGVMCFFYPFVPLGLLSSSLFQGVGKGPTSLFLTFMRSLVFAAVFAYLFAIPMGMGEQGVWWGIVAGEVAGGLLAFVWARLYLSKMEVQWACEVRKSEAGA